MAKREQIESMSEEQLNAALKLEFDVDGWEEGFRSIEEARAMLIQMWCWEDELPSPRYRDDSYPPIPEVV